MPAPTAHPYGRTPLSWRRRLLATLAAGTATLTLFTGCTAAGGPGESGATSARTKALIIADNEPPATFDPVQADNSTVDEVTLPLYDTLWKFDADQKLTGVLATEWSVSSDGRAIEVTLRDDVKFHDGTPLTAKDVAYTLDRSAKINIGVASLLGGYTKTDVTDDTHLTIRLKGPNAPIVASLSRLYILNSTLVDANAGSDQGQSWLATNDAGSGPYTLKSYTPNQQAEYTRYADYWGGFGGQAETVIYKYIVDAATQRSALLSGDVDMAMDITPTDRAVFETNNQYVVQKSDTNVRLSAFFKMKDSPLSNPKLREAITYAYDYQQHIDQILKGAGTLAVGPLPSSMQCFDANTPQPTLDMAKAKQLLAESGLKDVTLTMSYLEATTEMEQAATLLQSSLKELGITLKLSAITYPQYIEQTSSNKTTPDLGLIYAFPAVPDPDAVLYQNYNSTFINGGQNWGGFSDAKVDRLTEEGRTTTDPDARCKIYQQVQQLVAAGNPAINISNPQYVTVLNSRLSGYTYEPSHHQTVDFYSIKVS